MSRGATVAGVERAADWDAQWRVEPLDPAAAEAEERTPRWRGQERIVRERLGGFDGLRAIEIGAGRGLNGLLYARRGAHVTLLDESSFPLEQARDLYAAHGVGFEPMEADVFALPAELQGTFDGSLVNHGLNQALFKLGRRGLRVPQLGLPVLDRFAYELLLPVERP